MKIKILTILYLSFSFLLYSKEETTYTFKSNNFRIQIPSYWEIMQNFQEHKTKPLAVAKSKEDHIFLEIYANKKREPNLKNGFIQTLKNHQLWAENYTDLEQIEEFPHYNLKGYWGRTMGYKNKKKVQGYMVYATDGINLFTIHIYTNANLFPKNFLIMKSFFQGFALNQNYETQCCKECLSASTNRSNSSNLSCSAFIESEDCFEYFQNVPRSVSKCR